MMILQAMYCKTRKSASLRHFDTCFVHNIGGVTYIQRHDSLHTYFIDKESCHRLLKTPPILFIKHMSK